MIRALALTLVLTLAPSAANAAPTGAHDHDVVLDGVRVRLGPHTGQVVTVHRTTGYRARVLFWRHDDAAGRWVRVATAHDGRIGYGGLVIGHRRRQGTGTTPLGTYPLISAFGRHDAEAFWDLPYRRIRRDDFWVQDNRSRFYNRYRNLAQGGFRPHTSERLTDYRRQYEFSIVVGFNQRQVRHRGAGIFLHVNGRGATAGCVSAPRAFLRMLMTRLDAERRPVIAIGR